MYNITKSDIYIYVRVFLVIAWNLQLQHVFIRNSEMICKSLRRGEYKEVTEQL